MKIISHRGNIRGSILEKENSPSYIDCAIGNGFDVEVDIRYINGEYWLGHDKPQYKVDEVWLEKRKKYLWIHCKDLETAVKCKEFKSFCHFNDPYVYTTTGKIWLHDLSLNITSDVIIPLISFESILSSNIPRIRSMQPYAICSDHVYTISLYFC